MMRMTIIKYPVTSCALIQSANSSIVKGFGKLKLVENNVSGNQIHVVLVSHNKLTVICDWMASTMTILHFPCKSYQKAWFGALVLGGLYNTLPNKIYYSIFILYSQSQNEIEMDLWLDSNSGTTQLSTHTMNFIAKYSLCFAFIFCTKSNSY